MKETQYARCAEDTTRSIRHCRGQTTRHIYARSAVQAYICPECGTRQALASIGVDEQEQEEIIATIYSHGAALDGQE